MASEFGQPRASYFFTIPWWKRSSNRIHLEMLRLVTSVHTESTALCVPDLLSCYPKNPSLCCACQRHPEFIIILMSEGSSGPLSFVCAGASRGAGGGAQPLEQAAFRASVQMGRGPLFHSPGRLLWEAANLPLSRRTWSRHCALLIVTMSMESERSLWVLRTSAQSPWPDQTDVLWRSHIQPQSPFAQGRIFLTEQLKSMIYLQNSL